MSKRWKWKVRHNNRMKATPGVAPYAGRSALTIMLPIIREKGDYRLTKDELAYQYHPFLRRKPEIIMILFEKFMIYRRRALQRMWRDGEIIYGYSEDGE